MFFKLKEMHSQVMCKGSQHAEYFKCAKDICSITEKMLN